MKREIGERAREDIRKDSLIETTDSNTDRQTDSKWTNRRKTNVRIRGTLNYPKSQKHEHRKRFVLII